MLKKLKLVSWLICLVLMASLVGGLFSACGPEATPPPEAPPVVTPSPGAPPSPPPPPPPPKKHDEVVLELLSFPFGSGPYGAFLGIADLLNKNHPWLHAVAKESPGITSNVKVIIKDEARRDRVIGFCTEMTIYEALKGVRSFEEEEPYPNIRVLMSFGFGGAGYVTRDSTIKNTEDMKGKRIGVGGTGDKDVRGASLGAEGIWDEITPVYGSYSEMKDYLLAGTVDVARMVAVKMGDKYLPAGALNELMTTADELYFIEQPAWVFDKVTETMGLPHHAITIPKGSMFNHPEFPAQDVGWELFVQNLACDASMDEEVAYEFVKFYYEHEAECGAASSRWKAVPKEKLAMMPFPEELYHPGALKYYKEIGLQIGMD